MTDPLAVSKLTCVEAIELPRYRVKRSQKPDDYPLIATREALHDQRSQERPTTGRSSTDSIPPFVVPHRPVHRTLIFRRPLFFSDITVSSLNPSTFIETPVYHAQTYEWNFWQPDVVLYAGSRPDPAHILAVSRFRWSRDARMGFGRNCLDAAAADTQWEDMKNTSGWWAHYQYDFNVSESAARESKRKEFRWVRTHSEGDGVDGWAGWLSLRNYKLIDLETGRVVAVFLADNLRSLTKKGELRLLEPLAKEVEVAVVLSMCSISEKATRRGRAQRNGGNGE